MNADLSKKKIFIWQWGRYGAGPRYAYELAHGLRGQGLDVLLSLSSNAEIMRTVPEREVDLPFPTYANFYDFTIKSIFLPRLLHELDHFIEATRPGVAICAMPGIWDAFVAKRLQRHGIPVITIVHDVKNHPGDLFIPVYWLQRSLIRKSTGIITLTDFVARELVKMRLLNGKFHSTISHIPFFFPDLKMAPPKLPGYPRRPVMRLLLAGRLQAYKGLELFADALDHLSDKPIEVRVVGDGSGRALEKLADNGKVDFRRGWCTEEDLVSHIDWADVIVAPYIEATQSGIVTLALDRWRPVIATPVGGLPEQVIHNVTGLVTDEISGASVAESIETYLNNPDLYIYCFTNSRIRSRLKNGWKTISPQFTDLIGKLDAGHEA